MFRGCLEHAAAARDVLDETLEKAGYPILEIEALSKTETQLELAAILVPASAGPAMLDAVVAQLEKNAANRQRHLVDPHNTMTKPLEHRTGSPAIRARS